MKWDELSDQWHKYLKKEYWPDIAIRDPFEDMSEQLTDHKKIEIFILCRHHCLQMVVQ